MRDPDSNRAVTELEYVTLDLIDKTGTIHSVAHLADSLLNRERVVLLGDYGAGKSATLREIFLAVARRFRSDIAYRFPILLNLRDHHGQTDPVEALERHARRLGFSSPASLVRAWRGGFAVLLLDGFDEIAAAGWAGKTRRLRDLRYRSMELIRGFIRDTPSDSGVIISGRAHFFDGPHEMREGLSLDTSFEILTVSEFTDKQVEQYLGARGWKDPVPDWVPARPLLLGYLAARGLLQEALSVEADSGPAVGWNGLIERISIREAEIEAGIDPGTVRRLIEQLAELARSSADGLGPLTSDQIVATFTRVCGYPPDDQGAVLLQRLPGLGASSAEDGTRQFIDLDFAVAASGGAVFDYMSDPYSRAPDADTWQSSLWALGADVAALRCRAAKLPAGKILAALNEAMKSGRTAPVCADIVLVMNSWGFNYTTPQLFVKEVLIPEITLGETDANLSGVEFQDCVLGRVDLAANLSPTMLPRFVRCFVGNLEGRTGQRDLPTSVFRECTIEAFESEAGTTNAILSLSLPLGTKVVLTLLKKLYAQRGRGRRESALFRGVDVRAQQLVEPALQLLRRKGFAVRTKQGEQVVWMPTRSPGVRQRALSSLAAPHASDDPLIRESRELG